MSAAAQIREARPEDATATVAYVQRLSEEPGLDLSLGPGEFQLSVEQEAEFIAGCAATENSLFLVVEAGGEIVGLLTCLGGKRRSTRHVTTLGISLAPAWRNQGLGTALTQRAIDWARQSGVVKRLELKVFARNAHALHIYQKLGFEIEGSACRAIFKDGQYLDDYSMAILF
jgi:RimJ/RimL family protein N-acetyltransferase